MHLVQYCCAKYVSTAEWRMARTLHRAPERSQLGGDLNTMPTQSTARCRDPKREAVSWNTLMQLAKDEEEGNSTAKERGTLGA
ncbi:hypothetical protein CHU98_g5753 [Xylaria longipes]|nr:hypothetical protein CHU98_g5753 [Xylaria longipes]